MHKELSINHFDLKSIVKILDTEILNSAEVDLWLDIDGTILVDQIGKYHKPLNAKDLETTSFYKEILKIFYKNKSQSKIITRIITGRPKHLLQPLIRNFIIKDLSINDADFYYGYYNLSDNHDYNIMIARKLLDIIKILNEEDNSRLVIFADDRIDFSNSDIKNILETINFKAIIISIDDINNKYMSFINL